MTWARWPSDEHRPCFMKYPVEKDEFIDFLVVGASKSGTTTLHEALKKHPHIALPTIKETNFFALSGQRVDFKGPLDDVTINKFSITNWGDYRAQFPTGKEGGLRGEVCPYYLFSPEAPGEIARYAPHARIIMVLRNPVDRAFSNYLHLVRDGRETLSFEEALAQEEYRASQKWEWFWQIRNQGFYSSQVKRYLDNFPPEQVKVYIYERFFEDFESSLNDLLDFIGLAPMTTETYSRKQNVSGRPVPLIRPLYNLLMRPGRVNRMLRDTLPEGLRKRTSAAFKSAFTRRESIQDELRGRLYRGYAADIRSLENLLGQNLDIWRPADISTKTG